MGISEGLRKYADVALALTLGAVLGTEVLLWDGSRQQGAVPAALVATLPFIWRRSFPLAAFLAVAAGLYGLGYFAPGLDNDSAAFVVVFLLNLYSLGRYSSGREVGAGAVCVVLMLVAFAVQDSPGNKPDLGDIGFAGAFVGGPWAAGLAIRLRRDRERTLIEENELAVAKERARIARELHDVVAHAISVSVMQARGGRAMLGRDEDAVRRALDAIEQTNTAALGDMRRLLAVLRDTDGNDQGRAAPQPSLANLDRLVEQVRGAGLPVEIEVTGDGSAVPPGVDLSAYRIVQEALTNVIKHAGSGASAQVRVAYSADDLEVTVTDDGTGRGDTTDGGGHGLVGIRERVAVVGGRVEAGPSPDGGYAVWAHLPYALETQQPLGSQA